MGRRQKLIESAEWRREEEMVRKGWFSNTRFTTGLKTLLTFRPDALVFLRVKMT